ncbi:unnamed protein product [Dimorphilus gyrociliatus]|uniref:Core Histone H2A/H2B/H3 domain-containing protein n=1 Tax=Dimorphilus gyrociliatus TaxID=2664684 RepID=A0A7I8VWG7_9ANNE|nr:unnamed protein product [Dimorphilus gyrociliatus]
MSKSQQIHETSVSYTHCSACECSCSSSLDCECLCDSSASEVILLSDSSNSSGNELEALGAIGGKEEDNIKPVLEKINIATVTGKQRRETIVFPVRNTLCNINILPTIDENTSEISPETVKTTSPRKKITKKVNKRMAKTKAETSKSKSKKPKRYLHLNDVNFRSSIKKTLKTLHPDMGISSEALAILDEILKSIFHRVAMEARDLKSLKQRKTMTVEDIRAAIVLIFRGQLGSHAVYHGDAAIKLVEENSKLLKKRNLEEEQ